LAGGGSMLRNLDQRFREETSIPVAHARTGLGGGTWHRKDAHRHGASPQDRHRVTWPTCAFVRPGAAADLRGAVRWDGAAGAHTSGRSSLAVANQRPRGARDLRRKTAGRDLARLRDRAHRHPLRPCELSRLHEEAGQLRRATSSSPAKSPDSGRASGCWPRSRSWGHGDSRRSSPGTCCPRAPCAAIGHRGWRGSDARGDRRTGVLGRVDLVRPARPCAAPLAPGCCRRRPHPRVEGEALLNGGERRTYRLAPYTEVAWGFRYSHRLEGLRPGLLLGTTENAATEGLFTIVGVRLAARPRRSWSSSSPRQRAR